MVRPGSAAFPSGRGALQTAGSLASGAIDAVTLARDTLARIDACPDRAVFTSVAADRALREAAASARRHREGRPLGLLDGVPVAWKDLFDFAGEVTRAGSRVLDEGPAPADAALLGRLAAAGMVTVGKVNMTEFAFSGLGLNPHYGTPVNPWSRGGPRAPGGSSSGSAVAVALGLVPVSIGTDTSGSVRVPAAFNGLVGFKPSSGRWPMAGAYPLSETLDTAGVIARNVVDAAMIDAAACGLPVPDLRRGDLSRMRVVVPDNVVLDDVEDDVLANFEASIERLGAAGARIDRRAVPAIDGVVALGARDAKLVEIEAHRLHGARLASEARAAMDRRVVARLRQAEASDDAAYGRVLAGRLALIAAARPLFDDGTLLAYPTVPHVAPSIAALEADDALFAAINAKTLRNTSFGSMLDWCGISIPTGFDARGLPTSLLLSGGPGRDRHLLSMALAGELVIRGEADTVGSSAAPSHEGTPR